MFASGMTVRDEGMKTVVSFSRQRCIGLCVPYATVRVALCVAACAISDCMCCSMSVAVLVCVSVCTLQRVCCSMCDAVCGVAECVPCRYIVRLPRSKKET